MKSEKVSIVITTFGRKKELKRSLKSALNQTYENIEIIIIDDNIDIEYSEYIKGAVADFNDKRIVYKKNKSNLGGALSRNEGIKFASGKYVAFLDDDDEYLPSKVEKQLAVFERDRDKKIALVYCYCDGIKGGKVKDRYRYDYKGNCLFDAMCMSIAATTQWMCRKEALLSVGGFTNMPCKQDSYVMVKLLAKGYVIDRVPEVLSLYYDDEIPRISSKNAKKRILGETMLRDLCRQNYDKITKEQQEEVEYIFACVLAPYYASRRDWKKLWNSMKVALKRPLARKTWATFKRVIIGG